MSTQEEMKARILATVRQKNFPRGTKVDAYTEAVMAEIEVMEAIEFLNNFKAELRRRAAAAMARGER